jgi:hypothetical protein
VGEQVAARSKKRKTGRPDKDRTGFTSDLRRKEIFFLND